MRLSRICTPKKGATMIFGMLVGFSLSNIFVRTREHWSSPTSPPSPPKHEVFDSNESLDLTDTPLNVGIKYSNDDQPKEAHEFENRILADQLFNDMKILCWIMTSPSNHQKKAKYVLKTWGRRCNKLIFMSSAEDEEIGAVPLPVEEGRDNLWAKTKESFKYIYENHLNEYDWFLKADDDTFVIVENLRYMLYPYDAETPIYFGCRFKHFAEQGYMSGGAGYVLSREAVRRFVEEGIPDKAKCLQDYKGNEDVEIGKCLEKVNVVAGDSRDFFGRARFFPFFPERHLIPDTLLEWYWKYIYYKTDEGLDDCSRNAISFHYIQPNEMYVLDYLIYNLRPYGIVRDSQPLPQKLTSDNGKISFDHPHPKMNIANSKQMP